MTPGMEWLLIAWGIDKKLIIFLPRQCVAVEEENDKNTSYDTPSNQQPFHSRSHYTISFRK